MDEDTYEKELGKLRKCYFSLGNICCFVLNNSLVTFNQQGFRHFLKKKGGVRPIKDQLRQFNLFNSHVRSVLESRNSYLENNPLKKESCLISIIKNIDQNHIIKVIVTKKVDGSFCFLSIMDKKQK